MITRTRKSMAFLGDSVVRVPGAGGEGAWIEREGRRYYRISNYHVMPPFLMSVISGHDHWLFVSSTGGLTCGRRAPENALFPYCTDDKVHDSATTTGPVTALLVTRGERTSLWQPFAQGPLVYDIERNLYKNTAGTELVFEEYNRDLGLSFSYGWTTGGRFGFIRRAWLTNHETEEVEVELLDGLRNLMPAGVDRGVQAELSTLVDAYKQAEVVSGASAAIYSLSSILTDRAEPSEALAATVVWSTGLDEARVLLSEDALRSFCAGKRLMLETSSKGRRGAFLLHAKLTLGARAERAWYVVADVEQGPSQTANLVFDLRRGLGADAIEGDVAEGEERVERLVGCADGFQSSADELVTARHATNALFNIMRGGVFPYGYTFPREDFRSFVAEWNHELSASVAEFLESHEGPLTLTAAREWADESANADLIRLVHEYLPLTFSRRHGDPSRPWNHFCIELEGADREQRLAYQGNWRDIFQNWEALALSFPEYVESFITKFVNASTPDGFNPYRISRMGIDWEVPEPDKPWSNIGYWGDHQVCYLLRLLEQSRAYHPQRLAGWLDRASFVSADVPYRIKPYADLLRDPHDTVEYDQARADEIAQRVERLGADGKLVARADGTLQRVTLLEKLLLVALVRLGNLVPGGGVWMNTQRPEWNDANNALVGYGVSMVTLCYLRRYLGLLVELLSERAGASLVVTSTLGEYLEGVRAVLRDHEELLAGPPSAADRRSFMDGMGRVNDRHRSAVYATASESEVRVEEGELQEFLQLALRYVDHSISHSRREDGLFHAYNLIRFEDHGYEVDRLDEMLEGQVAVLSSGLLDPAQSLELLESLRVSRLYRADQNSYVLYPSKELPSYLEKNLIPAELVAQSAWIQQELEAGRTRYVERDVSGGVHFHPSFRNGAALRATLEQDDAVDAADARQLCEVYEAVFHHRAFTGRSGSMYKYEGLGCIYWHMVSKLLLASAEVLERATSEGADEALLERLCSRFRDIQDGIGVHKSPAQYGAFPIDAYSHTPGFLGVQQPGLTGQVKEDVITRFRELGVRVASGEVSFAPRLLRRDELLEEPTTWHYSARGELGSESLPAGSLAFTLCGVPVVYRRAAAPRIHVLDERGTETVIEGAHLGLELSQALFRREPSVSKLIVDLPETSFH